MHTVELFKNMQKEKTKLKKMMHVIRKHNCSVCNLQKPPAEYTTKIHNASLNSSRKHMSQQIPPYIPPRNYPRKKGI